MKDYIFTSTRLGFRNWEESDIPELVKINQDDDVMAWFPKKPSPEETIRFIHRMQYTFHKKDFCYFAVDTLSDGAFVGFIGLNEQTFPSDFTPCVDIGWRLKKAAWNNGYATEGARACLAYGFTQVNLNQIAAMAPVVNARSQNVMKKIGMKKVTNFTHPELLSYPHLRECVLFSLTKSQFSQ